MEAFAFLHTCVAMCRDGYFAEKVTSEMECSPEMAAEIFGHDEEGGVCCGRRLTFKAMKEVLVVGRISAETDVLAPGDKLTILMGTADRPVSFVVTYNDKSKDHARFGGIHQYRKFASVTALKPRLGKEQ